MIKIIYDPKNNTWIVDSQLLDATKEQGERLGYTLGAWASKRFMDGLSHALKSRVK